MENLQFVLNEGAININLMKGMNTDAEYKEAIRMQYNHLFGENR